MAKTFEDTIVIEVPREIAYQYIKDWYNITYESINKYTVLKKSKISINSDKINECFCYQEKKYWVIVKFEYYFKPVDDTHSKIFYKAIIPWSPLQKLLGQANLLGFNSMFKLLEMNYTSFRQHSE